MSTAYPLVKCIFASSPFVSKAVSPYYTHATKGGERGRGRGPSRKNEMRLRTPTFPEKNRGEKKTWLRKMPLLIGDSFSPLCFVAEKGKKEHFEGFSLPLEISFRHLSYPAVLKRVLPPPGFPGFIGCGGNIKTAAGEESELESPPPNQQPTVSLITFFEKRR